jgi:biopolymer transport protein ExbD
MQFIVKKRRPAPGVLIVPLIDILMVLLVFLMITTTFKKLPALRLTLPESTQSAAGDAPLDMVITITTNAPFYHFDKEPVDMEELRRRLKERVAEDPEIRLSIVPDTEAAMGRFVNVLDAAREADIDPDALRLAIRKSPADE